MKLRALAATAVVAVTAVPAPARLVAPAQPTTSQAALAQVIEMPRRPGRVTASAGRPLGLSKKLRRQKARIAQLVAAEGVPRLALRAYTRAAGRLSGTAPGCRLTWPVLAGIGRIESDHGQIRAGSRFTRNGTLLPPLRGPALTGSGGTRAVGDTDGGRLDGDSRWDHAVGPMQFLPSTWQMYGADGNRDGARDINNIFDSALAAGDYLCAGGQDLAVPSQLARAIFSYNHSRSYVRVVLYAIAGYSGRDPNALVAAAGPLAVPEPARARSPRRKPPRRQAQRARRKPPPRRRSGQPQVGPGGGEDGSPSTGRPPSPRINPSPLPICISMCDE